MIDSEPWKRRLKVTKQGKNVATSDLLREYSRVNFYRSRRFWTGVVAGVVISFLFAQPFLLMGLYGLKKLLLGFLPTSVVEFLWGHTMITFLFLWLFVPVAAGFWFYRGEYHKHEEPQEEQPEEEPLPFEDEWTRESDNGEAHTTVITHERFE